MKRGKSAGEIVTPEDLAASASLRHVSDAMPGLTRVRRGKGFSYQEASGATISDSKQIERIRRLAIPPAWTDIWICPSARGHLQATGRDDRGRKQYLYHPRWSEFSSRAKFEHMLPFGEHLARIRRRIRKDLSRRNFDRIKVLATVVQLLDTTLIRIGNREYAAANHSYGLTTFRDRHVTIHGSEIQFLFQGKSGRKHKVLLQDRRLARIVMRCEEMPGQALFQYQDADGEFVPIESDDVNGYLGEIAGEAFTAKDFRTWRGTALVLGHLTAATKEETKPTKRRVGQAIREAAEALGNTKTICRNSYIHPEVIELYLSGSIVDRWQEFRARSRSQLDRDEQFLLHVLRGLDSSAAP